jgi:hypothetical protein
VAAAAGDEKRRRALTLALPAALTPGRALVFLDARPVTLR